MWLSAYYAADATSSLGSNGTEIIQLITSALNLGVLGLVFWLFVNGKLHSSDEMDRAVADKEKAQADSEEAMKLVREQLLPLLGSFTSATSALLPILQALVARQELTAPREEPRDRDRRR